jgi:hypothetical protein
MSTHIVGVARREALPCPATDTDTIGFALFGAPPPFKLAFFGTARRIAVRPREAAGLDFHDLAAKYLT